MQLLQGNSAKKQMEAQQRQSLAQLASQQAEADQGAAMSGGRGRGRGLLTFLSGEGQSTLG